MREIHERDTVRVRQRERHGGPSETHERDTQETHKRHMRE
jgi:hypothetical protein